MSVWQKFETFAYINACLEILYQKILNDCVTMVRNAL